MSFWDMLKLPKGSYLATNKDTLDHLIGSHLQCFSKLGQINGGAPNPITQNRKEEIIYSLQSTRPGRNVSSLTATRGQEFHDLLTPLPSLLQLVTETPHLLFYLF